MSLQDKNELHAQTQSWQQELNMGIGRAAHQRNRKTESTRKRLVPSIGDLKPCRKDFTNHKMRLKEIPH